MTSVFTIECRVHFNFRGRGSRKRSPSHRGTTEPGRVPRVSRLMALAMRFDELIRSGQVTDYAELARLGHVSRARLSQITSLLALAPDIQEDILFLPRTNKGRDPIQLRQLLPITIIADWRKQRIRCGPLTEIGLRGRAGRRRPAGQGHEQGICRWFIASGHVSSPR